MTPALSTTAWVLHDLGLATGFGGSLFGKMALHPAVRDIASKDERGRVVSEAWKGFSPLNAIALGTMGLTWAVGRSLLTGREIDRSTRKLVTAKDALVATAIATGFGSMLAGYALSRSAAGQPPALESGEATTAEAPRRSKALRKVSSSLGLLNLIAGAGVIGITAVLGMKAGRSHRFPIVSRFLP